MRVGDTSGTKKKSSAVEVYLNPLRTWGEFDFKTFVSLFFAIRDVT